MATSRKVEVFSAGCPLCEKITEKIREQAFPGCEVSVLDMHDPDVMKRATRLGILSLPAVVIDDKVAPCCSGRGVDIKVLKKECLDMP